MITTQTEAINLLVVDKKVIQDIDEKYKKGPWRKEYGGLMLGYRDIKSLVTYIVGVYFPVQSICTEVNCEIDGPVFPIVNNILWDMSDKHTFNDQYKVKIVGWIHTHPHLRAFFSPTDVDNFTNYCGYDKQAVALVVDPYLSYGDQSKLAAFNAKKKNQSFNKIRIEVKNTEYILKKLEQDTDGIPSSIQNYYNDVAAGLLKKHKNDTTNILVSLPGKIEKETDVSVKVNPFLKPFTDLSNILNEKFVSFDMALVEAIKSQEIQNKKVQEGFNKLMTRIETNINEKFMHVENILAENTKSQELQYKIILDEFNKLETQNQVNQDRIINFLSELDTTQKYFTNSAFLIENFEKARENYRKKSFLDNIKTFLKEKSRPVDREEQGTRTPE